MLLKHIWLLFLYFSWQLLLLLKLYFHSLPQQSRKPFCCCAMLWAEVNSWWHEKHLNKSTIIFQCLYLKNRFHVAEHLFSKGSHMTSQFCKSKRVAHEMQRSLFQMSVINVEQNRKWHDSSKGVKKWGRLQHCLLSCYVLLTECLEQARGSWVCPWYS